MLRRKGCFVLSDPADVRIPIVEEKAHLSKRNIETERVRVRTIVDTHDALVSDTLAIEAIEIERRPADRPVPAAPPPRQQGDETIISVVEERLVVTKQLYVVEEVVVRRSATQQSVSAPVTLRAMRAVVEREPVTHQSITQQEDH